MAKLKLTTGIKTYEIEDEHGKLLCEISLNTTDLNLFNRISAMEGKVKKAIPDFTSISNDEDAMRFLESDVLPEADKKIRAIIDDAFDASICDKLFGSTNCLTVGSDGTTYVERFMDMIAPVIASDFNEAIKASEQRISKYTSQVK